jgi:hypothetical protein
MATASGERDCWSHRLERLPRQGCTDCNWIFHHKTSAVVLHPLEDSDGTAFYSDAEAALAQVPRRGVPMILHVLRVSAWCRECRR